MWIKATNGNVLEVEDVEHAKRALDDGHEVFVSDPREKGAKPWKPEASEDADGADE